MSFNTDWDVDMHKTEHESEEHWELRRSFMVAHKNKFPEERLVCLAQVFTNIEFLGCRYPAETMELIEELSQGVADTYREKQKTKLQRTFVKASDAAGAKVKGLKRPLGDAAGPSDSPPKIPKYSDNGQLPQNTSTSTIATVAVNSSPSFSSDTPDKNSNIKPANNTNSEASQGIKTCNFVRATETTKVSLEDEKKQESYDKDINGYVEKSVCKSFGEDPKAKRKEAKLNRKANRRLKKGISHVENHKDLIPEMEIVNTGKFGRLILLEDINSGNPHNTLERSTSQCNIPFKIQYTETAVQEVCCIIIVNGHRVVSVCDRSKKVARDVALSCALEKLKDVCYTLKVKKQRVPEDHVVEMLMITSMELNNSKESRAPVPKAAALATPLPEDNIGSKLMRSMGWTGGGLGKAEQGIQEPVSVSLRSHRAGLGADKKHTLADFKAKTRLYLLKYMVQDLPPNLIFKCDEFPTTERGIILMIANTYGLQTKSVGKGDGSYLQVSRKDPLHVIAAQMLRCGVYSDEFCELLKPKNPLSVNFKSECLEASDLLHHIQRSSSSSINEENGTKPENQCFGGNLTTIFNVLKSGRKERKRERRKEKSVRRAVLRRSERIKEKKEGANQTKQYNLEAIAAGPYGSFFLIQFAYINHKGRTIMAHSAKHNFVPVRYAYGSFKTGA